MKNETKGLHELQEMSKPDAVKQAFNEGLESDFVRKLRALATICQQQQSLKAALPDSDRQWLNEVKLAAETLLTEIRQTLNQPSESERLKLQTQNLRLRTQSLKMRSRMHGLSH